MKTKELQQKIVDDMRQWQKIEEAAMASTARVMRSTENPLIKMVMEIIERDSGMHRRTQQLIIDSLEKQHIGLSVDDLAAVWDKIEEHIRIEKMMVGNVERMLELLKGKKMVVVEYLLNYLKHDERKHDELLAALEKVKAGMYPYG